jgi:hypothetical protein
MKTWIVTVVLEDYGDDGAPDAIESGMMSKLDIVNDINRALKAKLPFGVEIKEVTAEEQ